MYTDLYHSWDNFGLKLSSVSKTKIFPHIKIQFLKGDLEFEAE